VSQRYNGGMDESEYLGMRRRLQNDHEAAVAEYHKNIDALERVWWLSHPGGEEPPQLAPRRQTTRPPKTPPLSPAEDQDQTSSSPQPDNDLPRAEPGEITMAVRQAVDATTDDFTWRDIQERLNVESPDDEFSRPTINQVLRRLTHEGQIEVVKPGSGRRSTVYRKQEPQE